MCRSKASKNPTFNKSWGVKTKGFHPSQTLGMESNLWMEMENFQGAPNIWISWSCEPHVQHLHGGLSIKSFWIIELQGITPPWFYGLTTSVEKGRSSSFNLRPIASRLALILGYMATDQNPAGARPDGVWNANGKKGFSWSSEQGWA